MTTATTTIGATVCWRMIDGCWATGEVLGHEAETDLYLVRRAGYPGGTVLLRADQIA